MKLKTHVLLLLLLWLVTLVHAQPISLFDDGFEGTFPPAGWLTNGVYQVSATSTTDPLGLVEPTEPYEGDYCAGMSSAPGNYMISPLKNDPGEYYCFVHKKDTGNYQFIVQFQVEDGVPGADLTGTWNAVGEYWASQGWWEPLIINLTGFAPGYIRIIPTPPPPTPLKYMYFDKCGDSTLPVELSSFTATLTQLQNQDVVRLNWITQSETQVSGYNVLRNSSNEADGAMQLNIGLIEASNTSMAANYEFIDPEIQPGTIYYWLQSNDFNGSVQLFGPISVLVATGDNPDLTPGIGVTTTLNDPYPNPVSISNPRVLIPFTLSSKSSVKLDIYNLKGQLIWSYGNKNADAGLYNIEWNGRDMRGKIISSGVYYCRLNSENYQGVKKLVMIK